MPVKIERLKQHEAALNRQGCDQDLLLGGPSAILLLIIGGRAPFQNVFLSEIVNFCNENWWAYLRIDFGKDVMCRITVVVYFFTLLLSCHVQNSSQLSAGQILQCQDCMRAVKQSYSIRYIDISIVLSLCLSSLAELHPMAFQ